jgi:hypothetical protein
LTTTSPKKRNGPTQLRTSCAAAAIAAMLWSKSAGGMR